uniref:Uncharacterized protein n=1 Tax=Coprothermobacter proteolyticus (strain ATCC 35245 / DSM 5265 / OCM 4 / BT) TaxID=309798 RepID=B5Y6J8_COPPD
MKNIIVEPVRNILKGVIKFCDVKVVTKANNATFNTVPIMIFTT